MIRIALLLFMFPLFATAQDDSLNTIDQKEDELKFINYLVNSGEPADAVIAIDYLLKSNLEITTGFKDSLNFYKAWSFYQQKSADSAVFYFDKINPGSPFESKSFDYGLFNRIYSGKFDEAELRLQLNKGNPAMMKLNHAGIALLKKDFKNFEILSAGFDFRNFATAEEEKSLMRYSDTLQNIKKRSGVVAGVLSAIVPGLGKVYAGETTQGIAAFLEVAALGGATAEYYFRSGPESTGFIIFGSLFSLFYIGNIWGSALSVSVKKNEFYQRIDNNIMVDLHVPLRRIYD